MEKLNGTGGVFFRARNPEALAEWYFSSMKQRWRIDFRVYNLEGDILDSKSLAAAGGRLL